MYATLSTLGALIPMGVTQAVVRSPIELEYHVSLVPEETTSIREFPSAEISEADSGLTPGVGARSHQQFDDGWWLLEHIFASLGSLGVALIAFFVANARQRKLEKKQEDAEYCGLLKVIAAEVTRNIRLEQQLHAYLYVRIVPTFTLTTHAADTLFAQLGQLSRSPQLLAEIMNVYFSFSHIAHRLDRVEAAGGKLDAIEAGSDHSEDANLRLLQAQEAWRQETTGGLRLIEINIPIAQNLYNNLCAELGRYGESDGFAPLTEAQTRAIFQRFQEAPEIVAAAQESGYDLSARVMPCCPERRGHDL